jgi:hypothetical protein
MADLLTCVSRVSLWHLFYMIRKLISCISKTLYVNFLKGSGCVYSDSLHWWTYEQAARQRSSSGQVYPNIFGSLFSWLTEGLNKCPYTTGRWVIFQIYIQVELEWIFTTSNVWSFDKYFVAK